MANIILNDIFDELRVENNRLFNEMQEISQLLNKYRNFSLDLQNICVCFQKSNNDSLIKSLEDEYQRIANPVIKREPLILNTSDDSFCVNERTNNEYNNEDMDDSLELEISRRDSETYSNRKKEFCLYCEKDVISTARRDKCRNRNGQWYHRKCSSAYSNMKRLPMNTIESVDNISEKLVKWKDNVINDSFKAQTYQEYQLNETYEKTFDLKEEPCLHCSKDCSRSRYHLKKQQKDGQWYHIRCRQFINFELKEKERQKTQKQTQLTQKKAKEKTFKLWIDMAKTKTADELKNIMTYSRTFDKQISIMNRTDQIDDNEDNNGILLETKKEREKSIISSNIMSAEEVADKQISDESRNKINEEEPSNKDNQTSGKGLKPTIDIPKKTTKQFQNEYLKNKYRFVCLYEGCKRRYESAPQLDIHIKQNHTFEKPFKCMECDKKFHERIELTRHFAKHLCERNPSLKVKCDLKDCEKYFYDNFRMRRHYRLSHSDKRWVCDWPECGKVYKSVKCWEDHNKIHLGIKEFECDFQGCNMTFTKSNYLFKHKRTHLKRFVCSWPGCEERFSIMEFLTSHLNKHQNIKPFECSSSGCGKTFYGLPQLQHHNWSLHRNK